MNISAINPHYNVATKSQTAVYPNSTMTTTYPAYVDEEETKSSNNMLGMLALSALAIAGISYGIIKHRDTNTLTKKIAEKNTLLETAKNELKEATQKLADKEDALTKATKKIADLEKTTAKPSAFSRFKNAEIWKKRGWPWNWRKK